VRLAASSGICIYGSAREHLDDLRVVEGTVRRGRDRLRICVRLVDAEIRTQLWPERYDGATEDIFDFQDRIAAHLAGAIHFDSAYDSHPAIAWRARS
jgi:TolB-like protein